MCHSERLTASKFQIATVAHLSEFQFDLHKLPEGYAVHRVLRSPQQLLHELRARLRRPHPAQPRSQARIPSVQSLPATGSTRGTCPGNVVDHVKALKHGGSDTPENVQWETRAEAKAEDRVR